MKLIQNHDIVLFQGDSITDCGRNREAEGAPNDLCGLGQGYAMMAAAELLRTRPAAGLQFFNRGISGAGHMLMAKTWLKHASII